MAAMWKFLFLIGWNIKNLKVQVHYDLLIGINNDFLYVKSSTKITHFIWIWWRTKLPWAILVCYLPVLIIWAIQALERPWFSILSLPLCCPSAYMYVPHLVSVNWREIMWNSYIQRLKRNIKGYAKVLFLFFTLACCTVDIVTVTERHTFVHNNKD